MDTFEIRQMLTDAAELGAKKALSELGIAAPAFLSKTQAQKMYGQANVERWLREGLVRQRKDGAKNSKIRIDRFEIEAVAKTSNRN